jgi:hypothetical protein
MASLNGYGVPTLVPVNAPQATTPDAIPGSAPTSSSVVIDGTPVRVVVLALAAAAGLTALRMAGFKFNVGVST